ncbi:MAG: HEPN domain-containing protein [bacterium]
MKKYTREHDYKVWLKIANEDLASAKGLLKLELFGTMSFHCQQCAEKILKAYLVYRKVEIQKTHDLVSLLLRCIKLDQTFENILYDCKDLKPYAVAFRYPSEYDVPDAKDMQIALDKTIKIYNFVKRKIYEFEKEKKLTKYQKTIDE